jgi:hypothetical protein
VDQVSNIYSKNATFVFMSGSRGIIKWSQMKQRIFLLLLLIELWALKGRAQVQDGETCLFTCMYHINKTCTISEYEYDFRKQVGGNKNIERDGAKATWGEMIAFIKSELPTQYGAILPALDSGYKVMTTLWVGAGVAHAIVIEGHVCNELVFYNPAYDVHDFIGYAEFMQSQPIYAIICK